MARGAGIALKTVQLFLRSIEFGCAAVILALFSYFLAKLNINHLDINAHLKSVEGISGAAIIYTVVCIALVCFLGGFAFFAFLAFFLDICFLGAFIYIAWETRAGASSCSGYVKTPIGDGNTHSTHTAGSLPSLRTACKMQTANFAVAIVAIVFFLLSAIVEIALWRHHKAESKYGPGPANNYTTGSGRRKFWQRKNRRGVEAPAAVAGAGVGAGAGAGAFTTEKDTYRNNDTLPVHAVAGDARTSYATDNTIVGPEPVVYNKYGHVGNGGVGDGYAAPPTNHYGTAYGETARLPEEHELSTAQY
ncbi:MAG: hypothetical protein M1818_000082 [Claussenomyces sp. TS43310]|nr:MAG: hypothetical protein M1818_000082 [Claussenomyces sp. TS43310]